MGVLSGSHASAALTDTHFTHTSEFSRRDSCGENGKRTKRWEILCVYKKKIKTLVIQPNFRPIQSDVSDKQPMGGVSVSVSVCGGGGGSVQTPRLGVIFVISFLFCWENSWFGYVICY